MHWLPEVAGGSRYGSAGAAARLRLPLVEPTAGRLAAALVAPKPLRAGLLEEALACDPALAWWAVLIMPDDGAALTTTRLATWCAARLAELLQATSFTVDDHGASDPVDAQRAARAVGVSLVSAALARQRGESAPQAALLGLLASTPDWLGGACADSAAAERHSPFEPRWLADERAQMVGDRAGDGSRVAQLVAQAERIVDNFAELSPELLSRSQLDETICAVRRGWLDTTTTARRMLGDLARQIFRLEQLEHSFQRTLEAEKLAALKEFAYGAGHEINNPLANISARAQTLLKDERDPERRRKLAAINSQAFRAHEMIADLMLFARPPRQSLVRIDLEPLVAGIVKDLQAAAAEQHTGLTMVAPGRPCHVRADRAGLSVALRAICVNALEALGKGGACEIAWGAAPDCALPWGVAGVQIVVRDNGPGISAEVRRHLFDPFYSGREAGRGLGFGLTKCWRIVQLHEGRIDVESLVGEGATFTITLPADNAAASA